MMNANKKIEEATEYYDFFNNRDVGDSICMSHKHFGDDVDKFKEEYNLSKGIKEIRIVRADNPLKLKVGFYTIHDVHNVIDWYTVDMIPFALDLNKFNEEKEKEKER